MVGLFVLLLAVYLPQSEPTERNAQPARTASGFGEESVGGPKPTAAATTNAPGLPARQLAAGGTDDERKRIG